MASNPVNLALSQLVNSERELMGSRFVAPVVFGKALSVERAGERWTMRVVPPDFHGWGVFHPLSHAVALLARHASGAERRQYLAALPAARLVVCARDGRRTFAMSAHRADAPVEVQLAPDCGPLDTLLARFDGSQFWFDELESRALDLPPGSANMGDI